MASSSLSSSPLLIAASVFGTIFVGFGINAIFKPASAISFFELGLPLTASADSKTVEALLVVYGIRDIFMGLAIYATAYFRNRNALGWILLSSSAVAFGDGVVCRLYSGTGEWNHWGYAPAILGVGLGLLFQKA
jgi:hypothetical protein